MKIEYLKWLVSSLVFGLFVILCIIKVIDIHIAYLMSISYLMGYSKGFTDLFIKD